MVSYDAVGTLSNPFDLTICLLPSPKGDVTMMPKDLQKMLAQVVLNTRSNSRAVLNVCLAYTSRNDMASAVRACAKAVAEGTLVPSDVTDSVISRAMMTNRMPDLDMLLR